MHFPVLFVFNFRKILNPKMRDSRTKPCLTSGFFIQEPEVSSKLFLFIQGSLMRFYSSGMPYNLTLTRERISRPQVLLHSPWPLWEYIEQKLKEDDSIVRHRVSMPQIQLLKIEQVIKALVTSLSSFPSKPPYSQPHLLYTFNEPETIPPAFISHSS